MDNLPVAKPHMVTWEQDRQELRDVWSRMTMAERLASSARLTRQMLAAFGRTASENTDATRTRFTVSRVAFRKR